MSGSQKVQLHWEYFTISRGGKSIYEQITKAGIENPRDYIEFFSLRKHSKINGIPYTELIYVHSKLMIVDDDIIIIGSANINDRSMKGNRDSEICIKFIDTQKIPSLMNGEKIFVSKNIAELRRMLYLEHLNFTDEKQVIDPLSEKLKF